MSDFRVSVHMHHFFTDHRSSSRLFITSKIKTVQDLHNHISEIFEINADFYLISNQLYLPSSENIRVLKEDDVIIAVPLNPDSKWASKSQTWVHFEAPPSKKKHMNKSGATSQLTEAASTPIRSTEDSNQPEPKKRKRAKDPDTEIDLNCPFRPQPCLQTHPCTEKEKKKDKRKKNTGIDADTKLDISCQKDEFNVSGRSKLLAKPLAFMKQQKKLLDNDSLAREIRASKKKSIELMKISSIPKIVKSIVVVDSPLAYCNNAKGASKSATHNSNPFSDQPKNSESLKMTAVSPIVPTKVLLAQRKDDGSNQLTPKQGRFQPLPSSKFWKARLLQARAPLVDDEQSKGETIEETPTNSTMKSLVDEPFSTTDVTVDDKLGTTHQNDDDEDTSTKMDTDENDKSPTVDIEPNDKRVNIISIECIFNQPTNEPSANQEVEPQITNPSVKLETEISTTEIVNENNSSIVKLESLQDMVDLDRVATNLVAPEQIPAESNSGVEMELAPTKRKRKRVRKRKPKPTTNGHILDMPVPVIQSKNSLITAAPVTHIRFDEEKDSDGNDENKEVVEVDLNYDKFFKKELVNFPIMKNRLPKQDDIISFKMYVLSKSYTPEISDFIIAKVLKYSLITNYVSLRIIEGAEQCCLPEGKFSIEDCGDQDIELEKELLWKELIEPRLLFP